MLTPLTMPSDDTLSCADLQSQFFDNQRRISFLQQEKTEIEAHNFKYSLGFGISGIFLPPLWFGLLGLDVTDAPQQEIQALRGRQNVLGQMNQARKCGYFLTF